MADPAVRILVAASAIALGLSGCDRLPQRSVPSAVTVKLPPPRSPEPGFAFKDNNGDLRETAHRS